MHPHSRKVGFQFYSFLPRCLRYLRPTTRKRSVPPSPTPLPSAAGSSLSAASSPSPVAPQSGPKVGSGEGELDFSS